MINYQTLFVMALVGFLGLSACAPTRVIEDRNDDGQLVSSVEVRTDTAEPVRHGDARWWFDNGQVAIVGNYKNGVRSGRWQYYYRNGELRSSGWHTNGRRDGRWLYFYPSGRLLAELYYVETSDTEWVHRNVSTGSVPAHVYDDYGGWDRNWVHMEVAAFKPYFEACYREHTSAEYAPEGEIVTNFTIDSMGVPIAAATKTSELDDEALEECIAEVYRGMQFPKLEHGGIMIVNYLLRFPGTALDHNRQHPMEKSDRDKSPAGDETQQND